MRHPRTKRALVGTAAALMVLAACGRTTTEPLPPSGDSSGSVSETSNAPTSSAPGSPTEGTPTTAPDTATPAGIQCEAPPAPPADVPSFTTLPPTTAVAGKTLTATIETNCGPITLELYGDKAPQTVASFQNLGTGGYWNNSLCHRLTTEGLWVLQCGDPTGTGSGAPGYSFGVENAPADGMYPAGTLAMARAQSPDSNGGQFFLVYQDTRLPTEGGGYTIFGKVTEGMDILQHVADAGVTGGLGDGLPNQPISILKVDVSESKA